jgi:tetracycline 7-halogenase / FADH2 O2-dependent halogenase
LGDFPQISPNGKGKGRMPERYDCVVIGSGIAGSTSALVLAQTGLQVLVIEAGMHPRFAIGESFLPTTTLGFDYLARSYAIPELRTISHYPELKDAGLTGWPKLGFWFGNHRAGVPLTPGRELLFVSPGLPIGPDVHVMRAGVDHFLVERLHHYGVAYQDQTAVVQFLPEQEHVELVLEREGRCTRLITRFVLDCTGQNSVLAGQWALRQTPPALRTNTRAIFSHFCNVDLLDDVLGDSRKYYRIPRDGGTIHHAFPGGWFWVIRFDNGVTSVGLVLDRLYYPDNQLPAEEEFWLFVRRYPTIQAQLYRAEAIRPFVKTGRIQFSSRSIVGQRFLLSPHAAAFVDPLFSTGVDLTTAFIARAAPLIRHGRSQ